MHGAGNFTCSTTASSVMRSMRGLHWTLVQCLLEMCFGTRHRNGACDTGLRRLPSRFTHRPPDATYVPSAPFVHGKPLDLGVSARYFGRCYSSERRPPCARLQVSDPPPW